MEHSKVINKALLIFILVVSVTKISLSQNDLSTFDFLIGNWQGVESGVAGDGIGFRTYSYELGGNYIMEKNHSTFPISDQKPRGEVHRDIGIFSYNSNTSDLVYRSFNVENFVNIFVLNDTLSTDSKYVFITREIENNPGKWRIRLILDVISQTEFIEYFDVATDGENFQPFLKNNWYKVK